MDIHLHELQAHPLLHRQVPGTALESCWQNPAGRPWAEATQWHTGLRWFKPISNFIESHICKKLVESTYIKARHCVAFNAFVPVYWTTPVLETVFRTVWGPFTLSLDGRTHFPASINANKRLLLNPFSGFCESWPEGPIFQRNRYTWAGINKGLQSDGSVEDMRGAIKVWIHIYRSTYMSFQVEVLYINSMPQYDDLSISNLSWVAFMISHIHSILK